MIYQGKNFYAHRTSDFRAVVLLRDPYGRKIKNLVGFRPYAHIRNIYDRELVKPLEVYHKNGIITLFLPQKEVEKLPIGDWEVFVDLYCERIKKLTRLLTSRLELEF